MPYICNYCGAPIKGKITWRKRKHYNFLFALSTRVPFHPSCWERIQKIPKEHRETYIP